MKESARKKWAETERKIQNAGIAFLLRKGIGNGLVGFVEIMQHKYSPETDNFLRKNGINPGLARTYKTQ